MRTFMLCVSTGSTFVAAIILGTIDLEPDNLYYLIGLSLGIQVGLLLRGIEK